MDAVAARTLIGPVVVMPRAGPQPSAHALPADAALLPLLVHAPLPHGNLS